MLPLRGRWLCYFGCCLVGLPVLYLLGLWGLLLVGRVGLVF